MIAGWIARKRPLAAASCAGWHDPACGRIVASVSAGSAGAREGSCGVKGRGVRCAQLDLPPQMGRTLPGRLAARVSVLDC